MVRRKFLFPRSGRIFVQLGRVAAARMPWLGGGSGPREDACCGREGERGERRNEGEVEEKKGEGKRKEVRKGREREKQKIEKGKMGKRFQ